jgi:hypothetical protein
MLTGQDVARDLAADLATCEAASGGVWDYLAVPGKPERGAGAKPAPVFRRVEDAAFCAHAHDGWPAAIRRALAAEEIVRRLACACDGEDDIFDVAREAKRLTGGAP